MPLSKNTCTTIYAGLSLCFAVLCTEGFRAGAAEPAPLMRDFIGINGHTIAFKPELYRPACGLVRD
jgi:hypothetical protein